MYTDTTLWKSSLANQEDSNDYLRANLREAFAKTRENASLILNKIRTDFPALTVHDITHVDGLWQVGSVIVGADYPLNPLEGFVLGCAFLMHDAVLSYEAAGGKAELRATAEWKDYYEDYKKDTTLSDEEQRYEADFYTIRMLHAKSAEHLYEKMFLRSDGSSFYIIEDESLRNHLGSLICKIAASHHWSIDEVEKLGVQQAALVNYPMDWRINPMKLACIIRCADAGHIDEGRAPDYLLKLLAINGVSRNHWIAQNHLSQIDRNVIDQEKVIICSNIDFKEADFAAWNVACDAVQVLEHEIKASNALLKENGIQEFYTKGVSGADSRQSLSKYIKTDGWMPCDANIHIGNVEGLIKNLGGEKLYGKENQLEIVLRELIQNARDSIVARRKLESGFDGKIVIKIEQIDGKIWVSVTDDGVGMSMQTIKDYFLNFGSSFWASDLAKSEYPGLNSSGFRSVGRYGIGFYAIFMIASEVIVETRKYDYGLDNNFRVKFPAGLCLRPIIAKKPGEGMAISTSVKFMIDEQKCQWFRMKEIKSGYFGIASFNVPYSSALSYLTAGLDVDVYYSELGVNEHKIHTNIHSRDFDRVKWLKDITYAEHRTNTKYVDYIENNHTRIQEIYHNGIFYGMAALNTLYGDNFTCFDVSTIGGLANFSTHQGDGEFLGCVFTEPITAKRDGSSLASEYKSKWAKEQYDILYRRGLTDADKLYLPYVIGKYGIDMSDVMKVHVVTKDSNGKAEGLCLELSTLLRYMENNKIKLVLPISSMSDSRIEHYVDFEKTFAKIKSDELLFVPETNSNFLNISTQDDEFEFNLMRCIDEMAKKLSLSVERVIENNKSVSHIGGNGKALVVTIL